jgi:hypothetical protein
MLLHISLTLRSASPPNLQNSRNGLYCFFIENNGKAIMNTKNPKTKKPATTVTKKEVVLETHQKVENDKTVPAKTVAAKSNASTAKTVGQMAVDIEKPLKIRKKQGGKVIRDSFSFPEIDYLKILQIKAICLAEGVHVKKGEVLRAGLQLLMQLNQEELKQVIGKVERVKTGRPLAVKE